MNQYMIIFALLLIIFSTTACTGRNGKFDLTKPLTVDMRAPSGPPHYRKGWQDGCESGLSATNDKIQLFLGTHVYTLDRALRYDKLYAKAWRYGYDHCSYSMKARYNYL